MSLVSARGFIAGLKEYSYRGIQQLPIILSATSFIFTIATGSIAHLNLAVGLGILMPIYSAIMQAIFGLVMPKINPTSITWKRSTGDTCDLVPNYDHKSLEYYKTDTNVNLLPVPSFWFMSVAFFIGYSIANAIDSLNTPPAPNSDPIHVEQRNTKAIFLMISIGVFFAIVLGIRFIYMRGCEGRGMTGIVLSIISALGAFGIGNGMYTVSRACGGRCSDLFGILSQMISAGYGAPSSSGKPAPIVCSAE